MNDNDRNLDILLRRNVERQLKGFNWDWQRQMVMHRLTAPRIQKPRRIMAIRVAIGIAAIVTLAVGYLSVSFLMGTDHHVTAPMEATATRASAGNDSLLASADPTTILLTGPMRWRVLNDPMLAPHSSWEQ